MKRNIIVGIQEIIGDRKEQILQIARRHGASDVRVFGSVADGSADEKSDVDFLVAMEKGRSLFDLGGLLSDLAELLGRNVDVVTEACLRKRIKDDVLRQAVSL